ncbi:hypothetical protein ACFLTC_00125 [Chloroflexota bacterium]
MTVKNTDGDARILYREADFAALSAYLQLGLEPDQDFEDAKQEAVLAFWDTYRKEGNQELSFVASRDAALSFLGSYKYPNQTVSLDALDHVAEGAGHSRIQV